MNDQITRGFDLQPTLQGRLLALRPLRAGDFDALYAVASDPLIWEQHPASDRWKPDVFRAFFDEAMASRGALLATDGKTGDVIGSSRYHDFNASRREVEIGWSFLARRCWGGRYNGEMKDLMLRHAFRYVDRVLFFIGPGNIRSQRAVLKLGAVRTGSGTNGAGRESWIYAISAGDYPGPVSGSRP